jgi:hypothetical protein
MPVGVVNVGRPVTAVHNDSAPPAIGVKLLSQFERVGISPSNSSRSASE